jgi:Fe-S-cluster containining protein
LYEMHQGETEQNRTCRRCGACCHVDISAFITQSDMRRWEKERRLDVLSWIQDGKRIWSGDRIISPGGVKITGCRFLNRKGASFFCDIYDTRPFVCRNYIPGSSEICPQHGKYNSSH